MINAFKYTRQLEEAGFSRAQAETQLQVITEIVEGDLATKQDLNVTAERLEAKMLQMEYRLIIKLGTIITVVVGVFATLLKVL